jgi:hypothetical protein
MRLAIPSATCIVLGFEIAFGGFVLNVLDLHQPRPQTVTAATAVLPTPRGA